MDRRVVSLGVHKKKPKKHNKKKKLLKKIIDYLKSDSYMFAPLVSSKPSDFPPTNTFSPSPRGVETEKPGEERNKKLLKKVGDYLKSDCYMYAPLVGSQPSHDFDASTLNPHSGPVLHLKRVSTAVSTRKIIKKTSQPTKNTVKVIGEDQFSDNSRLKSNAVIQQTLAHRETVKHVVHQNCRSSSVPGKVMLGTEARKFVVE